LYRRLVTAAAGKGSEWGRAELEPLSAGPR